MLLASAVVTAGAVAVGNMVARRRRMRAPGAVRAADSSLSGQAVPPIAPRAAPDTASAAR